MAGQAEVEQDEVVALAAEGGNGGAAVVDPIYGVAAVFEAAGYGVGNLGVVFVEEDALGGLAGGGRGMVAV